jgi:hypothetical protein
MAPGSKLASLGRRFQEQLFDFDRPETDGEQIVFKLLELLLLGYAVFFAWQWGVQSQVIAAVAVPHGIARDLDISFLVSGRVALLNAALISVCALAGLWRRTARFALPLLVLLMHLQFNARFSLGKISHGSHYVGLGLSMLAIAPWLMPTPTLQRRFVVNATLFFMGLGYFFAALSKLAEAGALWADGSHLWLWIQERSVDELANLGHSQLNAVQRLCLASRALSTLYLAIGLVTELCSVLLWFPRTRVPVTLALIGLHVAVLATMNIFFSAFLCQLALLGLPWARWFDRALVHAPARWKRGLRQVA